MSVQPSVESFSARGPGRPLRRRAGDRPCPYPHSAGTQLGPRGWVINAGHCWQWKEPRSDHFVAWRGHPRSGGGPTGTWTEPPVVVGPWGLGPLGTFPEFVSFYSRGPARECGFLEGKSKVTNATGFRGQASGQTSVPHCRQMGLPQGLDKRTELVASQDLPCDPAATPSSEQCHEEGTGMTAFSQPGNRGPGCFPPDVRLLITT